MIVSDARREANRRNASKSTGPKSEEGKAVACRNATRHGLTAVRGVALGGDEVAEAEDRAVALAGRFGPRDEWEGWLVGQLADATLKLDRVARREACARAVAAHRAGALDLWDEDRRREAEELGSRLARDPGRVVAALRRTPHGCDWLIARWEALARGVVGIGAGAGWDDEQKQLAHDLLGAPAAGRTGPIGLRPPGADGAGPAPRPLDLARARVEELRAHRDRIADADAEARALTAAGLVEVPSADVATLRRYERATRRHLGRVVDQMHAAGLAPGTPADRPAAPGLVATPAAPAALAPPDAAVTPGSAVPATLVGRPMPAETDRVAKLGDIHPTSIDPRESLRTSDAMPMDVLVGWAPLTGTGRVAGTADTIPVSAATMTLALAGSDVRDEQIERNEAIPAPATDETNPIPADPAAGRPAVAPVAPRRRPDLERLARRDRRHRGCPT